MSTLALDPVTHIHLDEHDVAWIDDTRIKVVEIVEDKRAHDSSPESMHDQYPHLSLAQIHAALAYYYDHRQELDAEVERRYQEAELLRKEAGDSPLRKRLRARANRQ